MQRVAKFPDVLMCLNLNERFPPPWDRIPEKSELIYECAKYGNTHAIFLCGLMDYYYRKQIYLGMDELFEAAKALHPEAMYLYGMVLISHGEVGEGSKYIKQLWKNQGIEAVRQCQLNCRPAVLELSVRQYRNYDFLLADIEVGEECVTRDFDEVFENCLIYKEIFRFADYMNNV